MTELLNELDATLTGKLEPTARRLTDLEGRLAEIEEHARLAASPALPALDGAMGFGGRILDVPRARAFLQDVHTRAVDTTVLATGGLLAPQQARRFITLITENQATLKRIPTRVMSAPQALLETLNVAGRRVRAASENTPPTVANAFSTAKRALTTTEVILAEDITLNFLEDNIEGADAEFSIAQLIATQFGNDLNDLAWNGDSAATGLDAAFLNINDGYLKLALDPGAHALNAALNVSPQDLMRAMLAALPSKYKSRQDLAFFTPAGFVEAYLNTLAARPDQLGAAVLVGGLSSTHFMGIPLIPEPALDGGGKAVLTSTNNLTFGIQRDLRLDSQYQPRKRAVEYTITARIDYQIITPDALVLAHDIPSAY